MSVGIFTLADTDPIRNRLTDKLVRPINVSTATDIWLNQRSIYLHGHLQSLTSTRFKPRHRAERWFKNRKSSSTSYI
uniref:Uncharacterized protein n=1 Tax=Pararge aegeria TaxID=116150 RepID=S4P8D7_9NEOP